MCGGGSLPPTPSQALPARGPESSSTQGLGRWGWAHGGSWWHPRVQPPPWCPEEPSHSTWGIQRPSSWYGFEVKRLFETKNQRKPLPNRLLSGVHRARASSEPLGAGSRSFMCEPGLQHAGAIEPFDCPDNAHVSPFVPACLGLSLPRCVSQGGCPGMLWGCPTPHI